MRDIGNKDGGTYANLATLLKSYKKSNDVVFLFGGNSIGPSITSSMDKGSSYNRYFKLYQARCLWCS
ncbi:hypothetical protein [Campylobacter pinnipediorum]|uniref:Uncharacterized protein n=1 Tax=Campylobacter pinnipediorum subsp. pinnipediorum TaxID=1660067 RepID=A0AAX0L9H2_9BACT|nr:hypothetical protein [Campylobacter pinnipediorum]OPA76385.1 hypothetical protein BFG04_04680 [Campylobacter pinnipediorum subsp. pinnipediorum]